MKFSFPTVVTLITVLVSASAESTFLRGDSMNHEDDTNFNHRELIPGDYSILSGDAEVMVKEEETSASKQECWGDGVECLNLMSAGCNMCCNGYHLGDLGLETFCGPQTSCWGKDTLCVPGISCGKCCNSWSMYITGAYCN